MSLEGYTLLALVTALLLGSLVLAAGNRVRLRRAARLARLARHRRAGRG